MNIKRVEATDKAIALIQNLREQNGPLMFHQSGGCCDGSQPMCFPLHEFKIGGSDVFLGEVDGCPFYMHRDQFAYWKHTHLTLDVTKGRGSSFSLEIPLGVRFFIQSRIFYGGGDERIGRGTLIDDSSVKYNLRKLTEQP